jgi:DNA polymerase-1
MLFNGREVNISIWKNEDLGKLVSCDTETTFVPFYMTPELCTVQVYGGGSVAYYVPLSKLNLFFNKHYDTTFIFHNAAFDLDVLSTHLGPRFSYDLIDRNLVRDTSILYRLYHLATKGFIPFKYNLALLTEQFCNEILNKNNDIRCTFDQYLGKPIEDIPQEHLEYGALDAIATFDVYLALSSRIAGVDKQGTQLSHHIQVKGDLALLHVHKNGIKVDLSKKDSLLVELTAKLEVQADILATYGWCRGLKGINDRYEQIVNLIGIGDKLPRTDSDVISSKGEDLKPYRKLPFVDAFLKFQEIEKHMSFIKNLNSERVHGRFTSILNTGRVSMSKPNLMQIPRSGGIREIFVAEEDKEFYIIDYSGMENAMLGQVLKDKFGKSVLADTINAGKDLHKYYASILFNKDEKDVTKLERQQAKAAVFGLPGGLGIDTFIEFSRGYGLDLTQDTAQEMKDKYFVAFPEMRKYLNSTQDGPVFTRSGRLRGNATYCAVANTPFQGSGADMAKIALYELDKAGFKIVNYIHDEVIIEQPKSIDRYDEACKIMVKAGVPIAPDMLIEVEGGKRARWEKM